MVHCLCGKTTQMRTKIMETCIFFVPYTLCKCKGGEPLDCFCNPDGGRSNKDIFMIRKVWGKLSRTCIIITKKGVSYCDYAWYIGARKSYRRYQWEHLTVTTRRATDCGYVRGVNNFLIFEHQKMICNEKLTNPYDHCPERGFCQTDEIWSGSFIG